MKFTKRLAEQVVVAGGLAFGAIWTASDGGFTKAAAAAGLAAAGRAVYGLLAKTFGSDPESPSVQ